MSKIYSPLRYPGGKNKIYYYIKYLCNNYGLTTYVEPFAGGASVALRLLINKDVNEIIINDYDKSIYSFWNTVKNNPKQLIKLIEKTPITIEEWYKQKSIQINKEKVTEIELAFSTLFLNRTNISGILKAGVIGGKNQNGNYKMDCRFNKSTLINRISLIASFSDRIKVCNDDAKVFIEKEIKKTQNSLSFFDPPYYLKGPNLYTNFFEHNDHVELANIIKRKMYDKHWILTYDTADTIPNLYQENKGIIYSLNYTISKPRKGEEFMFFSQKTDMGKIEDFLKVIK